MPRLFFIGQRGASILAMGSALLLGPATYSASARPPQEQQSPPQQQSSPSQQSSPAQQTQPNSPPGQLEPKKKKVWINEDLIALRTPADIYVLEKEAQELAAAEAAGKTTDLEQQVKDAKLKLELPPTAEATQQLIKTKEAEVDEAQAQLDQLNKDFSNAAEADQAGMQNAINAATNNLSRLQLELKFLRQHLENLGKRASQEPAPQQPASAPAPNPEQP